MCNIKIPASEMVYIKITNLTITEFEFPKNLKKLEQGNILAIQAYTSTDITKNHNNEAVVPAALLKTTFMTLESQSGIQLLSNVPLIDLQRSNNNGVYEEVAPMKIDFSKSKLKVGDATALAGLLDNVFALRVIYQPHTSC